MARMRLLDLALPFSLVVPEVSLPYQKVPLLDRAGYTLFSLILFLLLAEIGVGGLVDAPQSPDPIWWLRAPLGSSHGTLAELGLIPVVLSGVICQILAAKRKIKVSLDLKRERARFQSLQKIVALLISLVLSVLLSFSKGVFGPTHAAYTNRQVVVIAFELFFGTACVQFLDEVLSKGYGFAPGTVLFPLVTVSQRFLWRLLSPETVKEAGKLGSSTYGAISSLFFNLNNRSVHFAITSAVFRSPLPNLCEAVVAVAAFLAFMYLASLRLNLQIRSTKMRQQSSMFPVFLLYAGWPPLMLVAALLAAFHLVAYAVSFLLPATNPLVKVLGVYNHTYGVPVCGLASVLVPPFAMLSSPKQLPLALLRAAVYPALLAILGAYFSNLWVASSGSAPIDIAKVFKENSIVFVGKRETSALRELKRILPRAATIGGALAGLAAGCADTLAPAGWGLAMASAALNARVVLESLNEEGFGQGMPPLK